MLERSFNSARAFFLDGELVKERLRAAARKVVSEHAQVTRVILFGSFHKGNYAPGSDADVVVMLAGPTHVRFTDRAAEFQEAFEGIGVGCDVLVYTEDELLTGMAQGNLFFTAIAQGQVLAHASERGTHAQNA